MQHVCLPSAAYVPPLLFISDLVLLMKKNGQTPSVRGSNEHKGFSLGQHGKIAWKNWTVQQSLAVAQQQ